MKTLRLAVRLAACALPLVPPSLALLRPARILAQPMPDRRLISGRVTRADGAGVPRVAVTIQRESDIGTFAFWGAVTVTDAKGFFSFPDAEDGAYLISAEAPGYAPQQNRPLRVSEGSTTWNVRLDRLATLALRLVGPDGAPLAKSRAVVRLSRAEGANVPQRRTTEADGIVKLEGNVPGRYSLEVAAPGGGFAAPRDVEVKDADKPTPIDIRLQRGGDLKITARDANDANKLLGGATLSLSATLEPTAEERKAGRLSARVLSNLQTLYAWSPDGSGAATRDGDGELLLRDLPPGRYRAKLVLPAYAPSETREIEVKAGNSAALDFALRPQTRASSLKIRLRDKNNLPLANRDWSLQLRSMAPAPEFAPGTAGAPGVPGAPDAPAPPPGLEEAPDQGAFGVLSRRARSDAEGVVTLFPLRAGRWRVQVFPPREEAGRATAVAQQEVNVGEAGGEATLNFTGDLK
jgi:hypothetical protein